MDQDPFYSDYDDNEIDWNWRCYDYNVSMNPSNPFVAEIFIPIGATSFVQKYGDYVSADVKYIQTEYGRERWKAKSNVEFFEKTIEFFDSGVEKLNLRVYF